MTLLSRTAAKFTTAAASVLALSQLASAQPLPTATAVIAKYVAAIGGKDAVLKVRSMASTGTLDIPAMSLSGSMEILQAEPNKLATRTNIAAIGDMLSGFNGAVAWDINPMSAPRLLDGKELERAKESAGFHANLLFSADRFSSMDVLSVSEWAGEKAYKLRLVYKGSGQETTQYFSVASGLLLGSESVNVTQGGSIPVQQTVSDYKPFGDLLLPTKVEQTIGPNKLVITTKTVQFNAVPETAFDVPPQVKSLVKP